MISSSSSTVVAEQICSVGSPLKWWTGLQAASKLAQNKLPFQRWQKHAEIFSNRLIWPVSACFVADWSIFFPSKSWAGLMQVVVLLTRTNQQWGKARPHVGFKTCQNSLVFIIHLRHQSKQASKHPNACTITAPSCCRRRQTPPPIDGLLGLRWRRVVSENGG